MELNRNQFFMIGVVVVLLGVQFRLIDSITLNEKTTQFLLAHSGSGADEPIDFDARQRRCA